MICIKIITSLLWLIVAYEDLRYRWVHLAVFVLLFVCSALYRISYGPGILADSGKNLVLLAANYAGITLYFSLKQKRFCNVFQGLIGTGDFLFFLCCAVLLPFTWFCLFMPLSLIFSLVLWGLMRLVARGENSEIPLAGMQAIFLIGIQLTENIAGINVLEHIAGKFNL